MTDPQRFIAIASNPYAATRRAIVRAAAEIRAGITQPATKTDLPEDNYYKTQEEAFGIERSKHAE